VRFAVVDRDRVVAARAVGRRFVVARGFRAVLDFLRATDAVAIFRLLELFNRGARSPRQK
jgi:hypothetical protein